MIETKIDKVNRFLTCLCILSYIAHYISCKMRLMLTIFDIIDEKNIFLIVERYKLIYYIIKIIESHFTLIIYL